MAAVAGFTVSARAGVTVARRTPVARKSTAVAPVRVAPPPRRGASVVTNFNPAAGDFDVTLSQGVGAGVAVVVARVVRRDVLALDAAAPFAAGRVANDLREAAVRADRCRFAAPASDGLAALAKACDALAAALAGLAVDCAPPDRLRHRSDPQCAIFERGPGYAKHVDNPRGTNGRRLTLVYYANESIGDGGELRVDGRDIAPLADRLVVFAAETAVHEVRPLSSGWDDPRVAVTFWYCDYDKSATAADDADDADRDRDALATLAAARRTLVQ